MKWSLRAMMGCLFIISQSSWSNVAAQSWASKAMKSVFTLKTFGADGALIGSSNGFFVSENGDAVSSFTPFVGATRAVIIDAAGKEMPVESMLGANEMYDVAKFRVSGKKTAFLTMAAANAQTGQQVWMLPYAVKKSEPISGQIDKAETFQESYAYYTLKLPMPQNAEGCPLMNQNGEVVGMMQPAANSQAANGQQTAYAISARYVNDMKVTGFSLHDASLKRTNIKIALPDNKDEALLMMYMAGTTLDSTGYANMVDEFIARFPDAEDGYINRAQLAYNGNDFATAARYMQQAISMSNPKDNAHFAYSRLIYTYCLQHADSQYADWTLDKAAEEAKTAYDISQQAAYKHQLAQILFAQKKYDDALALFNELATSDMRGAEVYYETARCYEMKGDTTKMMALLDSAVNVFTKPYLKEAAPYIWARAMARMNAGKTECAVLLHTGTGGSGRKTVPTGTGRHHQSHAAGSRRPRLFCRESLVGNPRGTVRRSGSIGTRMHPTGSARQRRVPAAWRCTLSEGRQEKWPSADTESQGTG